MPAPSNSNYLPVPNAVTPGVAAAPFANTGINAPGSAFAAAGSYATSKLYRDTVLNKVFDATRQQYYDLQLIFQNSYGEVAGEEYTSFEKTWGRQSLTVQSWVQGTGVITLTGTYLSASDIPVSITDVVSTSAGQKLEVTAIAHSVNANASTITVIAMRGATLPATLTGRVTLAYNITADGTDMRRAYLRANFREIYNYIQSGDKSRRWSRKEYLAAINTANTDAMDWDKNECLTQLKADICSAFWQGVRGEFVSGAGGSKKVMNGIEASMIAAGAANVTVTAPLIQQAFKALAHASNFKKVGGVRMIYGTNEMLSLLSSCFKDPIRYAPNDRIASLDLTQYEFGNMKFVPVPMEIWRTDSEIFPAYWADRLIVLDQDTIHPVNMKGLPVIEIFPETNNMKNGDPKDFTEWTVRYNIGLRHDNPAGGFIINKV
jgi:hypothetical protein